MKYLFCICLLSIGLIGSSQVENPYTWEVSNKKMTAGQYEISFYTGSETPFTLYAPNQIFDGYHAVELKFGDSSVVVESIIDSGDHILFTDPLFNNVQSKGYKKPTKWKALISLRDKVPAQLSGNLLYTYGNGDELYPSTSLPFTISLEGGERDNFNLRRTTIDINHPVYDCGDTEATDKGLLAILLLGFGGGLIALLTPCVFPMIPLTVSFFTKKDVSKKKGIQRASLYAVFIFLIYVFLSAPFHFLDHLDPEVLNSISTNAWLNIAFFVIFLLFAFSFFGFYEIALPSSFVNKINPKAGGATLAGILFMALTLAIVSFSCTGPILGSLLAGAISRDGGALQLSFGMGGFGLGLALPFALFSVFPQWLRSLPKSGGWLTTVKIILGFVELALALKFLSNADMVMQWGIIKREVFIATWVIICLAAILYQLGFIKFPHEGKRTPSKGRHVFTVILILFTLYIIPGIFNTSWSRLKLISGFPPPVCYSIYRNPVNCMNGVKLLHDYEQALELSKKENRPILIDFTGWACVNCRRMEEKVWTDRDVYQYMKDSFIVVSLYVDERRALPLTEQHEYLTKNGTRKLIRTVGDKWATFQSENFDAVSQPQYAIINAQELALAKKKTYTPDPEEFLEWLQCGLNANKQATQKKWTNTKTITNDHDRHQ